MQKTLREFVKLIVEGTRQAQLSDSRSADWGSDEHIADLEDRVASASYWRDSYPRGSEKRGHYKNILSHLKRELHSARKKREATLLEKQKKLGE